MDRLFLYLGIASGFGQADTAQQDTLQVTFPYAACRDKKLGTS